MVHFFVAVLFKIKKEIQKSSLYIHSYLSKVRVVNIKNFIKIFVYLQKAFYICRI